MLKTLLQGEVKPFVNVEGNTISFTIQDRPVKEAGVNGCQVDDLIEVARDIVIALNKENPCRESSIIITKLDEALLWSLRRKMDREARGVEGTMQP